MTGGPGTIGAVPVMGPAELTRGGWVGAAPVLTVVGVGMGRHPEFSVVYF